MPKAKINKVQINDEQSTNQILVFMNYRILILLILIAFTNVLRSQNLLPEMVYPDTLRSTKDSFYVNSSKFIRRYRQLITKDDTLNLGTQGYNGVSMTIWTDLDTLVIPHVNFPNGQLIKIPVASPNETSMAILRFQPNASNFDEDYVLKSKEKIEISIPEVYELANIALYLSECSKLTGNHPDSEYTRRVNQHFSPFKDHQLIQVLNKNCSESKYWDVYYGFRENSNCFSFDSSNRLQYDTRYKQVYWDNTKIFGGHFRDMLYLVQDFVDKTKFREFYKENLEYYNSLVNTQTRLLPMKRMWEWIENEFPQKMDNYKVFFSPLIVGSHSTQRFSKGFFRDPEYQECIMFINSPQNLELNKEYSEELKKGIMSGIVFTEIDHNYVNPTSDRHFEAIKRLIADKDIWATQEVQRNYKGEYAIFNEYMTHALFCLYVNENYQGKVRDELINRRIDLMERRGFPKFNQFNDIFLSKMKKRSSVYESYIGVINAMEEIIH